VFQLLGSRLLRAQYGKCTGCLSQGDLRPAETHRNPGGDQRGFKPTPGAPVGVDTNEALHAMAFKSFLACRTQLCAVPLQALLNRCIVT